MCTNVTSIAYLNKNMFYDVPSSPLPPQHEKNDSITSSQINKEYIKTSYILSTTA